MDPNTHSDALGTLLGWADVEECTLPTVDRPLRATEFQDLFTYVTSVEQPTSTRAHLALRGTNGLAARARELAAAETACCSFFSFTIAEPQPRYVMLDIEVPPAHVAVLTGLIKLAHASMGGAT
jgi:hypothetical protein